MSMAFVDEPAVLGDRNILVITCQRRCDRLGEVIRRCRKTHQASLPPNRQFRSVIGGPGEFNINLFFADRIRHRGPVARVRCGRNASGFHEDFQIVLQL